MAIILDFPRHLPTLTQPGDWYKWLNQERDFAEWDRKYALDLPLADPHAQGLILEAWERRRRADNLYADTRQACRR